MEPLHPDLRKAEFKRYEVWATFDEKTAEMLRRTPMFRDTARGARCFLWSSHRVGPKKFFGLGQHERPTPDQIWQADEESKRLAQRVAVELLESENCLRVDIKSVRRKEATSRYVRGPQIIEAVAEMTSPHHRFVDGEPSELALAIERGREG